MNPKHHLGFFETIARKASALFSQALVSGKPSFPKDTQESTTFRWLGVSTSTNITEKKIFYRIGTMNFQNANGHSLAKAICKATMQTPRNQNS
jgi:hypothetical protein